MTNRFARPVKAVSSVEQIPVGTRVWKVYGIYPPSVGSCYEVLSEPYVPKNSSSLNGDNLFVDVVYLKSNGDYETNYAGGHLTSQMSLLDANIGKDNWYNDNYVFLSQEDAASAVKWFTLLYALNPTEVQAEIERKARISERYNSMHYDD